MGTRGPAPKPAWKQKLEGNPGKRRVKDTAKPNDRRPTCPTWLDEGAKAEWARVAPELERLGLLTQLDRGAFAAYCAVHSVWVDSERALVEKGRFYVAPGGKLRERPEADIANRAQKAMLTFAREFGMTPTSRARLSLPPPLNEEDEFDKWLLD